MRIMVNRTQKTPMGMLHAGVTYDVTPKSAQERASLDAMLARGFATEVKSDPSRKKKDG